jgi:biopolymer transport protein ExbD
MNLQARSREEPEINLTSLIDVVLLLLVFFMVSTSFVREAEISLRLPEASPEATPQTETESLEITITQTGSYLVNTRPLVNSESATLRKAIVKLVGAKRDMPVVIRADAQATHQAVVTAMDVAGRLGFVEVSIATVSPADG